MNATSATHNSIINYLWWVHSSFPAYFWPTFFLNIHFFLFKEFLSHYLLFFFFYIAIGHSSAFSQDLAILKGSPAPYLVSSWED